MRARKTANVYIVQVSVVETFGCEHVGSVCNLQMDVY